ncbi:SRPBCC domain-containing protein [Pararhizobium sp. YC-54]|uniref:SRPBCC family protein n=1 Tax=Pararhizobium sp. YC-54 TaxID=2986920 RepID=UPI0021F7FBAC|nr:SRPBCC domain-containing protein [Pararhizobium sp. YC-54]MCV9998341.1 SRPBCC domain-containing protein [Pararhizobium sp. YC-54]
MTARADIVPAGKADLVLTRTFNAPAALVYKVWTDPYHLAQWWGPHCFTNPVCEVDLRPGGVIRIHMKGPDGQMYPSNGTFKEIVENERLVFTSTYDGEDGIPMLEALNTVTFTEQDGQTVLTLHAQVLKATEAVLPALDGMEEGWSQSLEKLAAVIATVTGTAG